MESRIMTAAPTLWTYDDGFSDGAGHGETLADAIRAALDERAGPAENQLQAIRDALAAYEAEALPDTDDS